MRQIKIYDTTLRDGTQAEDFNLSWPIKSASPKNWRSWVFITSKAAGRAPTPRTRIFSPKFATTIWG